MSLKNTHTRLTGHPMEIAFQRKCSAVHLTESDSQSMIFGPLVTILRSGMSTDFR